MTDRILKATQGGEADPLPPYVVGRGPGGFIEVVDPVTGKMEQFASIESATSKVFGRLTARMEFYERVRREQAARIAEMHRYERVRRQQAARVAEMHRLDTLFSELWQLDGRG